MSWLETNVENLFENVDKCSVDCQVNLVLWDAALIDRGGTNNDDDKAEIDMVESTCNHNVLCVVINKVGGC